jgi:NADH:ubiquinone reductase (H+-translocating)
VLVNRDCSVPGFDQVFVIGDAAAHPTDDGKTLPAVAQVAMQQGKYVARIITKKISPGQRPAFIYKDLGSMATIGRAKAIAVIGRMKFSGFIAWVLWCVIHVFALIGFHNRWRVFTEWIWYYITYQPGARLIYKKSKE